MHSSSRPVALDPGLAFTFPAEVCANCGTTRAVELKPQRTKVVSSFFLLGGSELTFNLAVPACRDCEPTLKRTPLSVANRVLLCLLLIGLLFTALLVAGDVGGIAAALPVAGQLALAVLVGGALGYGYWFRLKRPRGAQTSHFQPVRILKLRRGFVQGEVKAIRFGFTHPAYEARFRQANQAVIQQGRVEVGPA